VAAVAIVLYHDGVGTPEQYDESLRRLADAGAEAPAGRRIHISFQADDGSMRVVDVWDSQESFEAFGQTLGPILQEVTPDAPPPKTAEARRIIEG
jgi:hypothetical protein